MDIRTKITNYFMVMTQGFRDLPEDIAADILEEGIKKIKPDNPNFIVFDPEAEETDFEDGGRTLHIAYPRLETKVYAKLDDYGSKEFLSENVGRKMNTQYMVTFLLAEEY